MAGFRSALTRCINNFAQYKRLMKDKETISGDDVKEGLVAVINVKIQNPQFEGQTKGKLGNSDVKGLVESLLNEKLAEYLELHQDVGKAIVNKAIEARRAREAAKKAKELIKGKSQQTQASCPANWPTARRATRNFGRFTLSRAIPQAAPQSRAETEKRRPYCR